MTDNEGTHIDATTVADVKVQLSGDVAAVVDGTRVDLGPAKCKAVFAALALSPDRPVSVSSMIDLVWGEEPPRTAEKTLQSYVTALRKTTGENVIERVGTAYRLAVPEADVDLTHFANLVDSGNLAEALLLWNGPPLVGLNSAGFEPTIVRFTEMFLDAFERHVDAEIAAGAGSTHLPMLGQLANEYPLRERLWASKMRVLYQAGRQGEALRAAGEARNALVEQLGIEPGAELRELEQRILAQDPGLDAPLAAASSDTENTKQRTVSFMFTDIENSTHLWERHSEVMRAAVQEHDHAIAAAADAHGGTIFKNTGDGSLAVFSTPDDAVNAAVAVQIALDGVHVGSDRFAIRIAISSGRAEARESDWFGPPLNVAARLLDAAHGSQILLGSAAQTGLGNQTTTGIDTTELGEFRLRGLSRAERVHQVLHASLPRRFPPLRTAMREDREAQDFPSELSHEGRVPFVGRDVLVDQLNAIWGNTDRTSSPTIVTLGGEPGVGKTRLVGEVARRLHGDHGAMVLYGRCPEDHPTAFRPFTEALTAYCNVRNDTELRTEMGPRPGYLAPLLPHLAERFPDITPVLDVSEDTRLEIFDAVTAFLESASTSPLVVILDDIHWADQATLSLLRHLAQHLSAGRLLVLATYRDVEVERTHPLSRVLADFRRVDRVVRLRVKGISAQDSVAMTEVMFGHELSEPGRELVERIADDAGGNPFFLQELLRHFMESGVVVRRDGRWTTNPDGDVEGAVPEGIREVVGRRLDRVSDECNSLLRTASAIPTTIDFDVLVSAGALEEDEALDLFDEALEAELIVDTPGGYEFSHALIRQSLYDEISTVRKLRLHKRIAEAIEISGKRDDSSIESMAFHFLEAATSADPEDVAYWGSAAAQLALDRFAYEEAYDMLDRVHELVEGSLSDSTAFALHAQRAVASIQNSKFIEATLAVEECLVMLRTVDSAHAAKNALSVAAVLPGRSLTQGTFAVVAKLIEGVDVSGLDPLVVATIEFELSILSDPAGISADGFVLMASSGSHSTRMRALTATGSPIFSTEDVMRLIDTFTTVVDQARTPDLLDAARFALAVMESRNGNISEMRRLMDLVDTSPLAGKSHSLVYGIARLAHFPRNVRVGDLDAARTALTRIPPHFLDGFLKIYGGRVVDFESDVKSEHTFDRDHPGYLSQVIYPHMHEMALSEEDIAESMARRRDLGTMCAAADAAWERGGSAHVDEIFDALLPASGQHCPYAAGFCVSAVDYHLALLAELRGQPDHAIELHLSGHRAHVKVDFALDQAMSTIHLVRLLARRGSSGDISLAAELAADASSLLANTQLERAKRLLREAVSHLPT